MTLERSINTFFSTLKCGGHCGKSALPCCRICQVAVVLCEHGSVELATLFDDNRIPIEGLAFGKYL